MLCSVHVAGLHREELAALLHQIFFPDDLNPYPLLDQTLITSN